jgi:hypothetical protein
MPNRLTLQKLSLCKKLALPEVTKVIILKYHNKINHIYKMEHRRIDQVLTTISRSVQFLKTHFLHKTWHM